MWRKRKIDNAELPRASAGEIHDQYLKDELCSVWRNKPAQPSGVKVSRKGNSVALRLPPETLLFYHVLGGGGEPWRPFS